MVANRLGHRVGAVDIFVVPVANPGFEISKKNLNLKMKMVEYHSRQRVGVVDTSLAPVPHPRFEISKKKFGPKNENGRIPFRAPLKCR